LSGLYSIPFTSVIGVFHVTKLVLLLLLLLLLLFLL